MLVAVVRGAVALKLVFMRWRRVWRVPFAVWKGVGGLTRRDLLGVRIGCEEEERGEEGDDVSIMNRKVLEGSILVSPIVG